MTRSKFKPSGMVRPDTVFHLCSQFDGNGTPPSLQGPTAKMRGPLLRLLGHSPTSNRPRPITASAWNCRGAIDNSIWSICRRCRQTAAWPMFAAISRKATYSRPSCAVLSITAAVFFASSSVS